MKLKMRNDLEINKRSGQGYLNLAGNRTHKNRGPIALDFSENLKTEHLVEVQ